MFVLGTAFGPWFMAPRPFADVGAETPALRRRLKKYTAATIRITARITPPIMSPMFKPDEVVVVVVTTVFAVGVLIGMGLQTYHWLAFYFHTSWCSLAWQAEQGYVLRNPQTKAAEEYQSE